MSEQTDAHEEDECLLCEPAGHRNCEVYAVLSIVDHEDIPLGESAEDHLVEIPVCAGHHNVLQQYRRRDSVEEVSVP